MLELHLRETPADDSREVQFFGEFPRQGLFGRFARVDLPSGKFPPASQITARWTANQDEPGAVEE